MKSYRVPIFQNNQNSKIMKKEKSKNGQNDQ